MRGEGGGRNGENEGGTESERQGNIGGGDGEAGRQADTEAGEEVEGKGGTENT